MTKVSPTEHKNRLKEILRKEGISERELSEASGVAVGTINRICNWKVPGSRRIQSKLVKGLNSCHVSKQYTYKEIFEP